ncbi:anthranilate synthase component I [Janibacter sp. YIM B02568]|uniref:anthranilate synthase component I n=1 Tax=Janibacter endophyticus TaxID=2806261 RepID=UPI001952295E|nr:anthranilate synthase component I [Janibacter endophyticus]MBM6546510.1 anthranilate synthase component I [Janibacter endophyticus]
MTTLPEIGYGRTWPDAGTFAVLAQDRRVIPVVRRVMADSETPVSVYRKLAKGEPGTFLLESAEQGVWSRWSIVGVRSRATLSERDGQARWIGEPPVGVPTEGSPVEVLRETLEVLRTEPIEGMPPLTSGMVGVIAYDAVRRWERVPESLPDVLGVPEVGMVLASDVAVLDHSDGSLLLIANALNYDNTDERADESYADAVRRLDVMAAELAAPAASTVAVVDDDLAAETLAGVEADVTPERFQEIVEEAKEDIRAGEVFQVVLSQRFSLDCDADPLDVYRALRAANPSPYMYYFRLPRPDGSTYDVVGGSPEALVTVTGREATTHPIAGTRPRGKSLDEDVALAEDLLADPKERAEHVMLVDLGRNDLQRVCEAGTVDCLEFMTVRRYSHVTHLESTVVGRMRPDVSAYDVLVATFPAGTLSGAPKPRALALIEQYERSRRGVYGGVVGYLDFHGDMDMAIAIRTALIADGRAHVQAGAGIVADSVPHLEHEECVNKATAALRAVATATAMRPVSETQS